MEKQTVPISRVLYRDRCRSHSLKRSNDFYPLFKSYKTKYNFANLKESIDKWTTYSNNVEDCVEQMLEVYNTVVEHGNIRDIDTATALINTNLSYVPELTDVKNALQNSTTSKPILEYINEMQNCDRVLDNHKVISNRFNIDNYIRNHYTPDTAKDCIFELCSFIDTYNSGLNSKYKVALEEVQYALYKNGIRLPAKDIVDYVTEYFIYFNMNEKDYGGALFDILESTIDESMLVPSTEFLGSIKDVLNNKQKPIMSLKDKLNEDYYKYLIRPIKTKQDMSNTIGIMIHHGMNESNYRDIMESVFDIMNTSIAESMLYTIPEIKEIVNHCTNLVLKESLDPTTLVYLSKDVSNIKGSIECIANNTSDVLKKELLEAYCKSLDKMNKRILTESEINVNDFENLVSEDAVTYSDVARELNKLAWNQKMIENTVVNETVFNYADPSFVKLVSEFSYNHPDLLSFDKVKNTLINTSRRHCNSPTHSDINRILQEVRQLSNPVPTPVDPDEMPYIMQTAKVLNEFSFSDKFKELRNSAAEKLKQLTTSEGRKNLVNNAANTLSNVGNTVDKFAGQTADKVAIGKEAVAKATEEAAKKGEEVAYKAYETTTDQLSKEFDERNLTDEKRERLLSTSAIPKIRSLLSTILKGGAISLFNPFIGVTYLVAKYATSSDISAKQQLLNELDVELTMVDKEIEKAEDNKDLKKMKDLLVLKKKLQSQYAALRYNITLDHDDNKVKVINNKTDVKKMGEED